MTNHYCHGDRVLLSGEKLYRCLLDGAVFTGHPLDGSECPNCERLVNGIDQGSLPIRVRTVREFQHPDDGWLVFQEELTKPGAEKKEGA